jgi:hypothetical protein
LDYIKENPRKDFTVAVNTNMCAPDKLQDKLLSYVNDLEGKIHKFEIYTSLESMGMQAEYTRYGLNADQFLTNCSNLLRNTSENVEFHIMTTVNILSAPKFLDFLNLMRDLRSVYQVKKHDFRVRFRVNYLRWPECLSIGLLSKRDKERYAGEWLAFMEKWVITKEKHDWQTFLLEDFDQVKRLCEFMVAEHPEAHQFEDFRKFIAEIDFRRETDFEVTFPELKYMMDANYYG